MTIGVDAQGALRREIEQGPNRVARLLPGGQLQNLPDDHQHGDDRGGFEIDRRRAVMGAHRMWEEGRRQRGDDAIGPGDADAGRNEGEHVEVARADRFRRANEEWPAGIERNRGREQKLHPVRELRHQPDRPIEMPAHVEEDERDRQRQRKPEAPLHVDKLGIGTRLDRWRFGLERHAADLAGPGAFLPNFRVHRAGEDRRSL